VEGPDGVCDGVVFVLDTFDDAFDVAFDVAFDAAFDGVLDGALDVAFEGVLDGAFEGVFEGAFEGVFEGVFEAPAAFLPPRGFLVPFAFGVLVAAVYFSQSSLLFTRVAYKTYQSYCSWLSSEPVHQVAHPHRQQTSSMGSIHSGTLECHRRPA
jgi:hypothetical protein